MPLRPSRKEITRVFVINRHKSICKSRNFGDRGGRKLKIIQSSIVDLLMNSLKRLTTHSTSMNAYYEVSTSKDNAHTNISINNSVDNKCMNLLFLPENHQSGADTCVLSKAWKVLWYSFLIYLVWSRRYLPYLVFLRKGDHA
jgi:hypothetical protein